jgi:hypothetical protein
LEPGFSPELLAVDAAGQRLELEYPFSIDPQRAVGSNKALELGSLGPEALAIATSGCEYRPYTSETAVYPKLPPPLR